MKKKRWIFTKGKQYKCDYCGCGLNKKHIDKSDLYHYCSSACHMWSVGMDYSDFY